MGRVELGKGWSTEFEFAFCKFHALLIPFLNSIRTLTARLLKEFPHIFGVSVSHTTRRPRTGEEDGVAYHFVSRNEMEAMIEAGKFVEVVSLFGNMYGTSVEAVDKVTEEGKVCIMDLEIEVKIRYVGLYSWITNHSTITRIINNREF